MSHGVYLLFAPVGHDAEHLGASVAADWYERNLKIFANLCATLEGTDERALVIYGVGHAYLLRQFIREAPHLDLVEITDYL